MTIQNMRSSRDYELEARATRHRLTASLDELSDRLTPGQVFDELLTYAKGGGGNFFRALTVAARENPVPSLLISAGCMMFLSEKMGLNRLVSNGMSNGIGADRGSDIPRPVHRVSDSASGAPNVAKRALDQVSSTVGSAASSVTSGVKSASDFVSNQASNMAEGVKQGAGALGEQVTGAADQLKRGAQDVGDKVGEYSTAISEQVADAADRTQRQATRTMRQVKDTTASFINDQPLLFAAIGLAVGAVLAAALPSTTTEDELMGEASDAVKGAVGEAAADQYETVKATATKIVQDVKTVAETEGLTASGAADLARNLGDKVKRVVAEAGATA